MPDIIEQLELGGLFCLVTLLASSAAVAPIRPLLLQSDLLDKLRSPLFSSEFSRRTDRDMLHRSISAGRSCPKRLCKPRLFDALTISPIVRCGNQKPFACIFFPNAAARIGGVSPYDLTLMMPL